MKRFFQRAETLLLSHGTQPKTIFFLAVLSVLDGFIPLLPAELFVLALCILQPHKGKLIVFVFAASSALSAFLLAMAFSTLDTFAQALSQDLLGDTGPDVLAAVRNWGPISMVFFSMFPDTPRSSIVLLSLSGVSSVQIAGLVYVGKWMLYAGLLFLMHHLPSRVGRWRGAASSWQRGLQRRASRFVAYCRRIRWLAQRSNDFKLPPT